MLNMLKVEHIEIEKEFKHPPEQIQSKVKLTQYPG